MISEILDGLKADDIAKAVKILKNGGIVALPTETVYGLAADARNKTAVSKIFIAKNRPQSHPLIVHINGIEEVKNWATEIPNEAYKLAEAFWPGPLTILLKKAPQVDDIITGGQNTIALRMPNNPLFLTILEELKTGLAAPSANPHKKVSPTSAKHVLAGLSGKIDAVLDGGECTVGIESTIIDLTSANPRILRLGPITASEISDTLGIKVETPSQINEQISGNMRVHYQPKTPILLLNTQEISQHLTGSEYLIHYSDFSYQNAFKITYKPSEYARLLYQALHTADLSQANQIIIEKPTQTSEWNYIWDRLLKASAKISYE